MNLYIRVTEIRESHKSLEAEVTHSQITTLSDDMSLREETKGLQHL